MFLEDKMSKNSKYVIVGSVVLLAGIILYNVWFVNTCPVKNVTVVNDLKQYQKTFDPEFCDNLVNEIIELNEKCGIEIEPIDCG